MNPHIDELVFDPKKDDEVVVCYDGKWGRRVKGTVLQRRGFAIQVRFKEYAEDNILTAWFVRTSPHSFGAFVKVENSLMKMAFGCKGDWYSVYEGGKQ